MTADPTVKPSRFPYRKRNRNSVIKHLIDGYLQEIQELNPSKDGDLKKLLRIIEVLRPVLSSRQGGRKRVSKWERDLRTKIVREAKTRPTVERVSLVRQRLTEAGLKPPADSTIGGWLNKKLS